MTKSISVIIVHYKVKELLIKCIESIYKSNPKTSFEILIVDNDEDKTIKKKLLNKFPKLKYIPNKNKGFGEGNNVGAKTAKGKYLFFLNPDTIVKPRAIEELYKFLQKNENVGIVAPQLLSAKNRIYPLQGTKLLTPVRALFGLSFINKMFPNNPISKGYWLTEKNNKNKTEVEVVPGTAFMISRNLFFDIGGFDTNFFLYFEEFDLCKRVVEQRKKLFIIPGAQIIHHWGESTKGAIGIDKIFKQSRFYYFKKNYGLFWAFFISFFLGINKYSLLLVLLMLSALVLYLFRISELMPFISDQAWFYLSAKDFIISGNMPLVGIASSHPWLHQGPLWTYLLIVPLFFTNFNPISPIIVTSIFGLASIYLIYKIGVQFFTEKFGLIAAALMTFSPLVVFHIRMPYHTTPITFFMLLLFYSLIKFTKGNHKYIIISVLCVSILYNLHLATVIFIPFIAALVFHKIYKQKNNVKKIFSTKIFAGTLLALLVPMISVIIYDFSNGFPQTVKYGAWFGYKFLQFLGIYEKSPLDNTSYLVTFNFLIEKFEILTIVLGNIVSIALLLLIIVYSVLKTIRSGVFSPFGIIFSITFIGLISFFFSNVPSEAYLVMLFPGLIFLFASLINLVRPLYLRILVVMFIAAINIYYLLTTHFGMENSVTIVKQTAVVKEIVSLISDKKYNLILNGDKNLNFAKNYEYLLWYYGVEQPSDKNESLKIFINEKNGIIIYTYLVK